MGNFYGAGAPRKFPNPDGEVRRFADTASSGVKSATWNVERRNRTLGANVRLGIRVGDGVNTWWIDVYTSDDVTGRDVIGDDLRAQSNVAFPSLVTGRNDGNAT